MRRVLAVMSAGIMLQACESTGEPEAAAAPVTELRVYYNPYREVDWTSTLRLQAQHHDHSGVTPSRIAAYDNAGYHVIGLQNYSGNRRLAYAWTARRWPPEQWLPADFIAGLSNVRLFLPNAEEVGFAELHFTSTFVKSYIEVVPDGQSLPQPWQYKTATELMALIKSNDGVACLAHPWALPLVELAYWSQVPCVEIYSAYAEGLKEQGHPHFTSQDRNQVLMAHWDRLLRSNQRILGIAVNDHFGPDSRSRVVVSGQVRDSGKLLVFAREMSLESYELAFRRGSFLAIRDVEVPKGNYPRVHAISVERTSIYIDTAEDVEWISSNGPVSRDQLLMLGDLPADTTYVRAEIRNVGGSVAYTQAFVIRPRGDIDGDGDVDGDDRLRCRWMRLGMESGTELIDACDDSGLALLLAPE